MTDPDSETDTDQNAQLQPEDTLADPDLVDVLDEGYSPPERPWNTRDDETLDERLADEIPDPWNAEDPALVRDDQEPEILDEETVEVGDRRAGRLTIDEASFDGSDGGEEQMVAGDAGIDGAGASAEEAAVHVVDDEE
ncbi:DUF5709 domain-containing protein [Pseudonocardia nematodicida]|uniref:DUF5709 domain-containing protein n=1 Tax=Pseudonocardia nematodicida TaxID=1206997 RepID=A0ABV1KDF5_9PSEU